MIFVTVGTHEQQFDRLVKAVDEFVGSGVIGEPVFIQTGYSTYKPKYCEWQDFVPYARMQTLIAQADVVVCHGGPSTFMSVLAEGKIPVVVPRQYEYGEHVNNHQVDFSRLVEQRFGSILVVSDVSDLPSVIEKARKENSEAFCSNNETFCGLFEREINRLFSKDGN